MRVWTERRLAISESQERMAVVVAPEDVDKFLGLCGRGKSGSNCGGNRNRGAEAGAELAGQKNRRYLPRAFLDTNGAHQETAVRVDIPDEKDN